MAKYRHKDFIAAIVKLPKISYKTNEPALHVVLSDWFTLLNDPTWSDVPAPVSCFNREVVPCGIIFGRLKQSELTVVQNKMFSNKQLSLLEQQINGTELPPTPGNAQASTFLKEHIKYSSRQTSCDG